MISSAGVVLGHFTLNIIGSTGDSTRFIFLDHQKIIKTEKVTTCFGKSRVEKSKNRKTMKIKQNQ